MAVKTKNDIKFTPTPLFEEMVKFYVQNKESINPQTGRKSLPKIYNSGSSRSSKTWTTIQMLYVFCNHNQGKGLYIGVFRNTLVDCRKYTYKDFVECFKYMGVYDQIEIVEYPNPKMKILGNTIEFMGLPDANKQAPRTDICFFNEAVEVEDQIRVKGLLMRCEKLAIFDWNPSQTDHWVFNGENEFNSLFTRTTYLDNPHLSDNIITNIESYCPWDFAESEVVQEGAFKRRVWNKPENERTPHPQNVDNGTVDKWYWMVYGEGMPTAREGAVFDDIMWEDEFPKEYDEIVYGLDFGFTNDPSVLTRSARSGKDLTIEYLTYQSTENADILFDLIEKTLPKTESCFVFCDSADTYAGEQMVFSLNNLAYTKNYDWTFVKTKKKTIITGIELMKRFRLHVVKSKESLNEFTNYIFKMVEGRRTNIPIDKYNHGIDSARYAIVENFFE